MGPYVVLIPQENGSWKYLSLEGPRYVDALPQATKMSKEMAELRAAEHHGRLFLPGPGIALPKA